MVGLHYIRVHVFGISQAELGRIAKCTQGQVSRWESGEREPSLDELRRIRQEAQARRLKWDDRWLFGDALPLVEEAVR